MLQPGLVTALCATQVAWRGWDDGARAPVSPHPAVQAVVHVLQQGLVQLALGRLSVPPSRPTSRARTPAGGVWLALGRLPVPIQPSKQLCTCSTGVDAAGTVPASAYPLPSRSINCAQLWTRLANKAPVSHHLAVQPVMHLFQQGWIRLARLALAQPGRWRWMIPLALLTCGRASHPSSSAKMLTF